MIESTGQSYIAGNWVSPKGQFFQLFNPYKSESMFGFSSCGSDEIEQARTKSFNSRSGNPDGMDSHPQSG